MWGVWFRAGRVVACCLRQSFDKETHTGLDDCFGLALSGGITYTSHPTPTQLSRPLPNTV